ncbi:hypothetical protein [Pseudoxanthomonas mexicana]|uniref:hypothetical protein n=1 Tax=Pseudoxanthomonas mexicana TaxID=128785 RepID=UPI00398AE63F
MAGIGEALALGSAAAWAVGMILARQLGATLPPLALNLLKNALVLLALAPLALLGAAGPGRRCPPANWRSCWPAACSASPWPTPCTSARSTSSAPAAWASSATCTARWSC